MDDKPSNEKSFHDDQPSSSKKPRIEILDDVIISRDDPMDLEVPETEDTSLVAAPTNLTNDITQGLSQILSNPGLMALIASVSGQKGGDAQPGPSGNNSSAPDMSMQRHGTGNMKQMENKLGNQGNQNLMNQLNSGNQMGNQMNPRQGNFFQQDSQGNQNNRNNPNMMMNQQNNSNNQRNNQQFGNMNQNRNQFNDNNEQDDDNYQVCHLKN